MGKGTIRIHIPDVTYFGGDTIHGVVELDVKSKLKSRGVRMVFSAWEYAYVKLGKQEYIQTTFFLYNRWDMAGTPHELRHSKEAVTEKLEPSVYRFPFSMQLPPNLPSSGGYNPTFRTKNFIGYIKYKLCAYVDVPMAFDVKHNLELKVGGELFDRVSYFRPIEPLSLENKKTFFFASGGLNMAVTVPKTNLVPGEMLPIKVVVQNGSTKPINSVKIELKRRITVAINAWRGIPQLRSYFTEKEWKAKHDKKVPPKYTDEFTFEWVCPATNLPSISRSTEEGVEWHVSTVFVDYEIFVRLDIPMAIDLKVKVPIKIMNLNPRNPIMLVAPQLQPQLDGASIVVSQEIMQAPQIEAAPVAAPVAAPATVSLAKAEYPVISGYEYPVDTPSVKLEKGNFKLGPEDTDVLGVGF